MAIFKTIKAWQKADDLVVKVYDKTKDFPRHELYGLTSQLRRSAVSVCANIAEGAGRGSLRDYIRFLNVAKGSLSEVEYLLHISHRLGYLSSQEYFDFSSFQSEAAKILTGFIRAKQRQLQQES
jgi:four helix bundle protein